MAVRPIVIWPDPRLREPTRAIDAVDDDVRALYRDLCETMAAYNGVGIAAIQIGDHRKMFLVESEVAGRGPGEPVAFINPEIVSVSDEHEKVDEGCLSFPGVYVPIDRPLRAKVRAMGIDGKIFEAEGEHLFARAILHEYDHLTGKLMVDFVGPLKKRMIKKKLEREQKAGGHQHGPDCDHHHDHADH
jgi:peptide deformylase